MSAYPLPVDRDPEELRTRIAEVPYWRYRLDTAPFSSRYRIPPRFLRISGIVVVAGAGDHRPSA